MTNRIKKLYDRFVDVYGEELEGVFELLDALVEEVPDATTDEIVDFVVDTVVTNNDEVGEIDDVVADFSATWGRKL